MQKKIWLLLRTTFSEVRCLNSRRSIKKDHVNCNETLFSGRYKDRRNTKLACGIQLQVSMENHERRKGGYG